jgi:glycosyltransferase involved in cell wall biosynthesis
MRDTEVAADATCGSEGKEFALRLPLVSIVVVNWNYGCFIAETIESIRAQDYPNWECLIVDNASTDNSLEVARALVGQDLRFTIIALDKNYGHLGAAEQVLDRLRGEFISFVDSDDVIFPNFLSWHIQTHLALPDAVGFTSSDLIQVNRDGAAIAPGFFHFARYTQSWAPRGLRLASNATRLATISDDDYELLSTETIRLVPEALGWWWSPGTSNVYRRQVLMIARPVLQNEVAIRGVDHHYNWMMHALSGSALINRPLSVYRLHGGNAFNGFVSMSGLRDGQSASHAAYDAQIYDTLRTLLVNARQYEWQVLNDRYWRLHDYVALSVEARERYWFSAKTREVFALHFLELAEIFGQQRVVIELRHRMRRRDVWEVLRRAYSGRIPRRLRIWLTVFDGTRFVKRMLRAATGWATLGRRRNSS